MTLNDHERLLTATLRQIMF